MTIKHMKIFIVVYQTNNITQAAAKLHMTQPAVTRAIKEIEAFYGVCLFDRINHRLHRTSASDDLYPRALHIVDSFDEAESSLTKWDSTASIRLGCTTTLGVFLLPGILCDFKKKHSDITIQSTINTAPSIEQGLLDNSIDLALIENSVQSDSLHTELLSTDQLLLVFSPEHPFSKRKSVSASEIIKEPLLLREKGSTTRTYIDNLFSLHAMTLSPDMESVSPHALIAATMLNLGITFLPEHLVKADLEAGRLCTCPLKESALERKNYIAWHKDKYITSSMKELIAAIMNMK